MFKYSYVAVLESVILSALTSPFAANIDGIQ